MPTTRVHGVVPSGARPPAELIVFGRNDAYAVVRPEGDVDRWAADALAEALRIVGDSDASSCIVDLASVELLSATAIGILVAARDDFRLRGMALVLVGANVHVAELLRLARLDAASDPSQLRLLDDASLALAIGCEDRDALTEAHRRHAVAVGGLARRVVGDFGAEEVLQDVFLRLWRAPERFDGTRGSLRSYLLLLTRGLAIDSLRSDTRRRSREEQVVRSTPPESPDIESVVLRASLGDAVRGALRTLPSHERIAIELAYFGDQTYVKVAELLGVPEGTVKARIRAGLKRLRTELPNLAPR